MITKETIEFQELSQRFLVLTEFKEKVHLLIQMRTLLHTGLVL